ncbi:ATP-binding protein [Streptomyces bathyalis]|uniref:ATP-binding protein n=1 Tax=Streptomyces bathyalis TaxID=2710756 RepID=UPI0031B5E31D
MTESSATGVPSYSETLPRVPESVAKARRLVSSSLRVWHLEGAEDTARLVVSELVTNTVAHTRLDCVRVTISRVDEHLVRVAVTDRSQNMPEGREAGLDDESGRGLALVDALSTDWGVDPLRWGKRVWADVKCGA